MTWLLLMAQAGDNPIYDHLVNPFTQAGFAGFCAILLGILVWFAKQLLTVQKDSNQVISGNTEALNKVIDRETTGNALLIEVKDLLLSRPCLKDREPGG